MAMALRVGVSALSVGRFAVEIEAAEGIVVGSFASGLGVMQRSASIGRIGAAGT